MLPTPIVNLEESPGKTVGRFPKDPVEAYARLLRASRGLRRPLPFPRGVFRFRTHEEANQWETKYIQQAAMALRRATPTSATSPGSAPN